MARSYVVIDSSGEVHYTLAATKAYVAAHLLKHYNLMTDSDGDIDPDEYYKLSPDSDTTVIEV